MLCQQFPSGDPATLLSVPRANSRSPSELVSSLDRLVQWTRSESYHSALACHGGRTGLHAISTPRPQHMQVTTVTDTALDSVEDAAAMKVWIETFP